jgi:hypothetical protein
MGLNLSTHQIAAELDLNKDDAQQMTSQLRVGMVEKKPEVLLSGEVECDELYLIAGFKGQPTEKAEYIIVLNFVYAALTSVSSTVSCHCLLHS